MKRLIIIALLITLSPCLVHGQAGAIGLFSDPVYTNCHLGDYGPALVPIYVVHKLCPGAAAARFMVISGGGLNMPYLGEIHHMPVTFGDSQTGVCMAYGPCLASDILLITINYFGQGLSELCSWLRVVAEPTSPSGSIEVMDCAGNTLTAHGAIMYVNRDGSCDCGEIIGEVTKSKTIKRAAMDYGDFCFPLPTHESSWGQVKALYE